MKKFSRTLTLLAACLLAPLAAAQGAAMPDILTGADVSAEDRQLAQEEAQAFTSKACIDGTFTSVTMPKPPQLTFADALEATNAMIQEQSGEILKQEATDESGRLHASVSGFKVFSFSSLVGDSEVKTVGCNVQ